MTKRCIIITGGPFYKGCVVPTADKVIACDRGFDHALRLGLAPDLVVGDFDSYSGALPNDVPVVRLPVVKDDTDTGYALRQAVDEGYRDVVICFALGGRLDHTLANLQSATAAAQRGAVVTLLGQDTRTVVFAGEQSLAVREGEALSVLALTDACTHVCIEGAQYTLADATLTNDYPLGVSNAASGTVRIAARSGVLAAIVTKE